MVTTANPPARTSTSVLAECVKLDQTLDVEIVPQTRGDGAGDVERHELRPRLEPDSMAVPQRGRVGRVRMQAPFFIRRPGLSIRSASTEVDYAAMTGTMRRIEIGGFLMVSALLCFGMAACNDSVSPAVSTLGSPTRLELRALDGSVHHPIPQLADELTVLIFSASDCPVANGYAPEIRAIHSDYVDRGVRFYLVNVEASTSVEALSEHAAEYELPGPILMDRDHALAALVGAEVTPEAVLVRPGGAIAYCGRINDQHPELGVRRPVATTHELRDALESVLAGRPVAVPRAAAVGCFIEDWAH
ncbi:MAG: hypothetical protein ACJAQ3_000363 [Planctomycetota bacterium]|jgi:hypothetical protein